MTDSRWHKNPLKLLFLGSLEREVLTVVCELGAASVRDVCGNLSRPLAYTTIMTTLDRLYKKDLLQRQKEGRGFRYTPHLGDDTKEEQGRVNARMRSRAPLVSYLLEAVGTYDEALLQELERTIAERRKEFEREGKL